MTQISFRFGVGETGNAYLGEGWTAPQRGGVLSAGALSELALPLGRAPRLRLHLLWVPPAEAPPRLVLRIDDRPVGEAVLSEPRMTLSVALPPGAARSRRIALVQPDPTLPRAAIAAAEAEVPEGDPVLTDDLLVPPASLLMDGSGSAEHFRMLGDGFVQISLIQRAGLQPDERVLEIGSGNGQKARSLARFLSGGSYEGLDIVPEPILWCRDRYAHLPRFRFQVADLASSHYRPEGAASAAGYRLPYEDGAFGLVFLCSVFTHMLPGEVANYTREIARVLRRGGRCVATYFLLTGDEAGWAEPPPMQFAHEAGGARVLDAENPAKGVALPEAWVRAQWRAAGMRVAELSFGRWSGAPDRLQALQDSVLAMKP